MNNIHEILTTVQSVNRSTYDQMNTDMNDCTVEYFMPFYIFFFIIILLICLQHGYDLLSLMLQRSSHFLNKNVLWYRM